MVALASSAGGPVNYFVTVSPGESLSITSSSTPPAPLLCSPTSGVTESGTITTAGSPSPSAAGWVTPSSSAWSDGPLTYPFDCDSISFTINVPPGTLPGTYYVLWTINSCMFSSPSGSGTCTPEMFAQYTITVSSPAGVPQFPLASFGPMLLIGLLLPALFLMSSKLRVSKKAFF